MTQDPRPVLTERLAELQKRELALEKHLRGQDGRLGVDASDRAAFTEMDEVIEKLDDEARAEIGMIRSALGRLDANTYGVCTKCGETIAAGRLVALPHAAHCVGCAAR